MLAVHDGHPVSLSDVLALATPWLTTKTNDVLATGRFGIGLMTLRAVSNVIDVHSGPYHVRLGEPTISWAGAEVPGALSDPHATTLCLPVDQAILDTDDLVAWIAHWDESALLFLKSVKRVAVLTELGSEIRTLSLAWSDDAPTTCSVGGHRLEVHRRHATAPGGRRWLVHSVEVPTPRNVQRARKKTGPTVPLALALAMHPEDRGGIYAGLPIAQTSAPLRVNAQFDPVTSRTTLASTSWNRAMLPLLADLWVEVVEDLFSERPVTAWHVVPLPEEDFGPANSIVAELESQLLIRARSELATRAAIVVDGTRVKLSELAIADAALDDTISPEEVATLAGLRFALTESATDAAGRWRTVLSDWRESGAPLPPPVTVEDALTLLGDNNRTPAATIKLTAVALSAGLKKRVADLPCVVTSDGAHIVPPTPESAYGLMVVMSPLADALGLGVRLAGDYLTDNEAARLPWQGPHGR